MSDVRLTLGAVAGWYGPGRAAVSLFLGFVVGSVLGVGLALRKGKMKGVKMPFGPSLIAGPSSPSYGAATCGTGTAG
jgi:prepilin signal peptidase PulO-like enzyme (type II secretory pathway)